MAEQTITSANSSTQQQIVVLEGEAAIKDASGQLQPIKAGDTLLEGQVIVTSATGHLTILLPNGQIIELGADRSLLIDGDLVGTNPTDSTEAAIAQTSDSADQILNALNQGKDLSDELDPTAAGLNAGAGTDEGSNFVRLLRIVESVDPISFDFGTERAGFEPLPDLANNNAQAIVPDQVTNPVDVNTKPVGQSQNALTLEDTPVSGQLDAKDADGDTLSFSKISDPIHGTVTVDTNGGWTYTPNQNYNGADSFQVQVSDGKGGTDTLTIDIGVTPVNDNPIPADPNIIDLNFDPATGNYGQTTPEDTPVSGKIVATDPDGDTLSYTVSGNPTHGSVVIRVEGSYTYPPNPG